MADTKECFIIMPLTMPETTVPIYRDGEEHFKHVLDCLFIPAIEKAGYRPKPPIARGADLIHAEIIKNLETADIVLCDMSTLNPNVFFEFGIRTAINKPVSVVKDDRTEKVPFDTGILNYHEYSSSIEPWLLGAEVNKLADHIKASAEGSEGENTLWRHFGLKSEAVAYKGETGTDAKLDYLTLQMDSLRKAMDTAYARGERVSPAGYEAHWEEKPLDMIVDHLVTHFPRGARLRSVASSEDAVVVGYSGELPNAEASHLAEGIWDRYTRRVRFEKRLEEPKSGRSG